MPPEFNKNISKKRTIVTIIVVFVLVIVIATAVAAGIYFWRRNTVISQLKNDLSKVAISMESGHDKFGAYPVTIPVDNNDEIKLSGGTSFDGTTYCITGTNSSDASIVFHIDSNNYDNPEAGMCTDGPNISLPSMPGNLAIASSAVSSIKLTWDITPYAADYNLQCAIDDKFTVDVISVDTIETTGTCEKLKANAAYYCRVRATNKSGNGYWSETIKVATLAG